MKGYCRLRTVNVTARGVDARARTHHGEEMPSVIKDKHHLLALPRRPLLQPHTLLSAREDALKYHSGLEQGTKEKEHKIRACKRNVYFTPLPQGILALVSFRTI